MYIIPKLFRNYYYFKNNNKSRKKNKHQKTITPILPNHMETDENIIGHLMREKASKAKLYS